jgi:hypothetical protein
MIYCTRENRRSLKALEIELIGRQLGSPPKPGKEKLDRGERNPMQGKFGQGKTRYGLGLIKARLKGTSESWVSMIIMVMNLVRMGSESLLLLFVMFIDRIKEEINEMFLENSPIRAGRNHPRYRLLMTY